jgi:hypothetical protein
MERGVPLATIQRWLGHHNISQTSTYLAASGGGDAEAMRAFETAAGRLPLPHFAPPAGSDGRKPTPSDQRPAEHAPEIPNTPDRVETIH